MDIYNDLKKFGLNKTEIKIYLFLLENGLSSPPQIEKGTQITRTNIYHILRSLLEKNLIKTQTKGRRKVYIAEDPRALMRSLESKKEYLQQMLPDLQGLFSIQKNKPKVEFFDGFEQIKEIYFRSMETREKAIYAIGSIQHINIILQNFLEKTYFPSLKDKKIHLNDILSSESKKALKFSASQAKKILKGYYNYRFLSPQYQEFLTDILIWDDNIAMINFNKPMFGTIIKDKTLSMSFRIIHNVMWDASS